MMIISHRSNIMSDERKLEHQITFKKEEDTAFNFNFHGSFRNLNLSQQSKVMLSLVLIFLSIYPVVINSYHLNDKALKCKLNHFRTNSALISFDYLNENKLPWIEEGYSTWSWKGNKINYVELGGGIKSTSTNEIMNTKKKPTLLLIHGFGASAYHWRYNIPYLARKYHVYAIDKLGFGLSDKPILDYSAELWRDQVLSFIEEVIMKDTQKEDRIPCVVAGNSIGGFTALYASSSKEAMDNNLIGGCILLNAAGYFKSNEVIEKPIQPQWIQSISAFIKRLVIGLSFVITKQPQRIAQVLRQVYPVNSSNVDDELVESIRYPADNPNAAEVFYRVIERNGGNNNLLPTVFMDDLLQTLKVPLLLLWGIQDPWIRPLAAEKIQVLFPEAMRVDVNAGHCPHDEAPEAVNIAIEEFMNKVYSLT